MDVALFFPEIFQLNGRGVVAFVDQKGDHFAEGAELAAVFAGAADEIANDVLKATWVQGGVGHETGESLIGVEWDKRIGFLKGREIDSALGEGLLESLSMTWSGDDNDRFV